VDPVTVYIANLDALPESMMRSILDTPGIEVVGTDRELPGMAREADDRESEYWGLLVGDIEKRRPRVVIFGRSSRRLAGQLAVLADTQLLVLSRRGAAVDCCELHPDCETHVELGAQDLVALIRASGQRTNRATETRR